jgi:hypothetical protein
LRRQPWRQQQQSNNNKRGSKRNIKGLVTGSPKPVFGDQKQKRVQQKMVQNKMGI